jgi:hypothetical protein
MTPRLSTSAIWLAAAVVAVGAGTIAVVAAAADTGDRLTQDEIARQLEEARRGSSAPTGTQSPTETASPSDGTGAVTLTPTGALIQAVCDGSSVYLASWSPRPGYRVDEVSRGPAEEAFVYVESDSADDVTIFVRCENGTPVASPVAEDDDGGNDDDGGGSGPGGGDGGGGRG